MIDVRWRTTRAVVFVCALSLAAAGCGPQLVPEQLWLYQSSNLAKDDEVEALEDVWRRAAAAGYTHVMLADTKFARLGEMNERYLSNCRRVRALGEELGLTIVPAVFQVGRSNSMLALDPNLAEGLPVRDASFEVRDGRAHLVPDPPVGFVDPPEVKDWGLLIQDGIASVRDPFRRTRFAYRTQVQPHRCYRVSARIKTVEYTGKPLIHVLAEGRAINFVRTLGVEPTQDWTEHQVVFNSLEHDEVMVYFGVWERASGMLDWRDWTIQEVGPVNVLDREGVRFTIEDRVEGRDYQAVRDTLLGTVPWPGQFEIWHEPPAIRTSLPDGTRLRASWHQAAIVYDEQVTVCPSEPAVFARLDDEVRRMRELWGADAYMMMHDEIRVMNRDATCRAGGRTAGAVLAEHVRQCIALLDGSLVYAWNDMYDPLHNATEDYYLVQDDLAGSWEGLSPQVVIVNWNAGHARESLQFFADRGHRQVIAGYYDGEPAQVRDWLRAAAEIEGVVGVMYTTWRDDYDDLEAFARICRPSH